MNPSLPINNKEQKDLKEEPMMMIGRSQSIWQEDLTEEKEEDEKKEHLAQEYDETKCCENPNIDYVYDYIYDYVKENQLKEAFVQSTRLNCSDKHLL